MSVSINDIAEYYDTHQCFYSRFWSPAALHYGFWYDDTKNLAAAVANTDKFVAEILAIDSHDVVLDAGCGIGGTSLYIAEATGARVEGITLSQVQLRMAKGRATKSAAAELLSFSKQDYTCTEFNDATFSKIFAIESICHANDKSDFLREAYRIMRPGGRLAVVDAFLARDHLGAEEQKIYKKSTEGWVVPNLPTQTQFSALLAQAGFKQLSFFNMQSCVEKSVKRIYRYSLLTLPVNFVKSKLGLVRQNFSALYQKSLFNEKIAIYGVFLAEKNG